MVKWTKKVRRKFSARQSDPLNRSKSNSFPNPSGRQATPAYLSFYIIINGRHLSIKIFIGRVFFFIFTIETFFLFFLTPTSFFDTFEDSTSITSKKISRLPTFPFLVLLISLTLHYYNKIKEKKKKKNNTDGWEFT